METNESILTREVVAIDDRKKLGGIKGLCVDCDTCAVSHYIINSANTGSELVLPFDKSVALGDTFMTIQSRNDIIPTSEEEAKKALQGGFRLIGVEVFTRTGNRLGVIESFEFDPVYGTVTKILLGKRSSFGSESFVFFSPDFVFIDDGEATASELRTGVKKGAKKKIVPAPKPAPRRERKATPYVSIDSSAEGTVQFDEVDEEAAPEGLLAAEESAAGQADADADIKAFLIGAVVSEDVESKDGAFKVAKGDTLTKALVDEAQKHDALLLLTMSVEV
ncbi:MAG: hypothetical protein LBG81_07020 [Coriobacteriaceae bacterium]|jgi:sporulation protein YlmC with PRC-barrel domain|nr:hypothetical protein [Coriobacteriaceae bacterium]